MPTTIFPRVLPATLLLVSAVSAQVSDFSRWALVEDPASPFFDGSSTSSAATLTAGAGFIAPATDIGFQSVDGATPASSTLGFSFSPAASFSLAIDYALSFTGAPSGFLGLGFGIGEDRSGTNSAGISLVTFDGTPFASFGAAARTDNTNETPLALGLASTLSGTFFVSYNAPSGDVTAGASTTPGAASPADSQTFSGLQNGWNDEQLLASFFLRSVEGTPGWAGGGTAEATFSNFRILDGTGTSIPEPAQLPLLLSLVAGLLALAGRRRV